MPRQQPAGRRPLRGLALVFLMVATLTSLGAPPCRVCGREVTGRYLHAAGQVFCSPACYRQSLPTCAICGAVVEGAHLVHEGRHYCSEVCFRQTLPTCAICGQSLPRSFVIAGRHYCQAHAEGPRCDACDLPVGQGRTLRDGRVVCADCEPELVFDTAEAGRIYARAAEILVSALAQPLPPAPPLSLVGLERLPSRVSQDPQSRLRELGRYVRETETTTSRNLFGRVIRQETRVTAQILILDGLTMDRFLSTAAHELTHHLLAERYPDFASHAPDWAEEGLAQYVAALVCRRLGLDACLAEIETSDDPVYGDGYRYMARRFGTDGGLQITAWLATTDGRHLPAQAPTPHPR